METQIDWYRTPGTPGTENDWYRTGHAHGPNVMYRSSHVVPNTHFLEPKWYVHEPNVTGTEHDLPVIDDHMQQFSTLRFIAVSEDSQLAYCSYFTNDHWQADRQSERPPDFLICHVVSWQFVIVNYGPN